MVVGEFEEFESGDDGAVERRACLLHFLFQETPRLVGEIGRVVNAKWHDC
jgi:hypothetical protein